MTQPDVMVTADLGPWRAAATGGGFPDSVTVEVWAETEEEVRAKLIAAWNDAAGTSWAPDQFAFVRQDPPDS